MNEPSPVGLMTRAPLICFTTSSPTSASRLTTEPKCGKRERERGRSTVRDCSESLVKAAISLVQCARQRLAAEGERERERERERLRPPSEIPLEFTFFH